MVDTGPADTEHSSATFFGHHGSSIHGEIIHHGPRGQASHQRPRASAADRTTVRCENPRVDYGTVRARRIAGAFDCGELYNPKLAESQWRMQSAKLHGTPIVLCPDRSPSYNPLKRIGRRREHQAMMALA